jgi:hypothetical protein
MPESPTAKLNDHGLAAHSRASRPLSSASAAPVYTITPATPGPLRLLHLWHLCSLDAPCVTIAWTLLLASGNHVSLATLVALFAVVWIIYAADRLLDARRSTALEQRHRFHRRHERILLPLLALAAVVVCVALLFTPPVVRTHLMLLGLPLLLYAAVVHAASTRGWRLPKEIFTSAFFAVAVCIAAQAPLANALPLGALCLVNCVLINRWEGAASARRADRKRVLPRGLVLCACIVCALGIYALGIYALILSALMAPAVLLACAAGGLLLLALHIHRRRMTPLTLRAAADLAMLTPALCLLLFRRV